MSLKKKGYIPRIVDAEVVRTLKDFGAVLIEGPKWCGKTWTSLRAAKSVFYLGDPARNFENKRLAEIDLSLALAGENPRLIDEWQEIPRIWDAVRFAVDDAGQTGLFLLTGSSTPKRKGILHSGAGRIAKVKMRPMSLYEMGVSTGAVSLRDFFEGPEPASKIMEQGLSLDDVLAQCVRGGWPVNAGSAGRKNLAVQYLDAVLESARDLDGGGRDIRKITMLVRSLARCESQTANNNALIKDLLESENEKISEQTLSTYLDVLARLYITDDIEAYNANIRSRSRLAKSAKRHFVDPSIAAAALRATSDMLKKDIRTAGFIFESLCIRDLLIYAQSFGGELLHYRDYDGRKIDAVVKLRDGRWGAFGIKLGSDQIDLAAEKLINIKRYFTERSGGMANTAPTVMAVITGVGNAFYKRPDGVYVLPIGMLKN